MIIGYELFDLVDALCRVLNESINLDAVAGRNDQTLPDTLVSSSAF